MRWGAGVAVAVVVKARRVAKRARVSFIVVIVVVFAKCGFGEL
jgi:hypothetical protein